jgi:hypothetical protein
MPIQLVPNTDLKYLLIAFDTAGRERHNDPDGVLSRRALEVVRDDPITDVFLFSHGWMGGMPEARNQYGAWTGAMASSAADIDRMLQRRLGFRPLLIGLHWPSKPFGADALASSGLIFAAPAEGEPQASDLPVDPIDRLAEQTADTPAAREALRTILAASEVEFSPPELPPDVRAAYEVLDREIGLGADGPDAAPGDDREPFDPDRAYQTATDDAVSFGGPIGDGLLSPLRTLSFWRMKDRACKFGEGGAHQLLEALRREAVASGRDVRFHLMGHSFGCIVASAMVAGPPGSALSVDSLSLVQGALSIWSYCADIPYRPGRPGYFRRLLDGRVRGPILTTRSAHDRAVGTWYPWAAGAARQVDFAPPDELPRYGAIGAFGARGPGITGADLDMLDADGAYSFRHGTVYNLDGTRFIRHGGGFAGAHGDIANPQIAHAVWQAAGA